MVKTLYPRDFVSRRLHSILGLWLVIYLIEHLLVNSQAALLFGNDGAGFIHAVNAIHDLPYLPVLELVVLGLPFLLHGIWGILYLFQAKFNSTGSDGRKPALQKHSRNHAYSWQRVTAWLLLVGIVLHVVQMRFIDYPASVVIGGQERVFVVRVGMDEGLYTLSARLGVQLLDRKMIEAEAEKITHDAGLELREQLEERAGPVDYNPETAGALDTLQTVAIQQEVVEALLTKLPSEGQVAAVCDSFGVASLLTVRNTFKDPWMIFLYTVFVLAAVYHGFRGLWSFSIVWGFTLSRRAQYLMSKVAVGFMLVVGFLGLAAVWLTYWVNLRH